MDNCIFCKIAAKEIPAQTVYEDGEMVCFKDINPAAPLHLLLIPKVHFDSLAHAAPEHQPLLGKMMLKVPEIAKASGLTDGFKTLINTGKGGGQRSSTCIYTSWAHPYKPLFHNQPLILT